MTDAINNTSPAPTEKYHALIVDSGAIIKQSTFTHLHHSAKHFYTVPAVLNEVRDAKSRQHLEEFQMRLASLPASGDGNATKLETRLPSPSALAAVSEFARKTGDYPQLSGVDLQILALLYELECEACETFGNTLDHVRREPKRVLGVSVRPLNGDGKRADKGTRGCGDSVSGQSNASDGVGSSINSLNMTSFFSGNADGIIDAGQVDIEYDDDEFDEETRADSVVTESAISTDAEKNNQSNKSSWAMLVNPNVASTAPLLNYYLASTSISVKSSTVAAERVEDPSDGIIADTADAIDGVNGQFDDASESSEVGENLDSDDEARAIQIANAGSDEEMSDEECDVFILEPHEAAYFKKLKEQKALNATNQDDYLVAQLRSQKIADAGKVSQPLREDDERLDSEFPSLAAAAAVPYDGSDDEYENDSNNGLSTWEQEEEERKKKSLQPMVNGRIQSAPVKYKSFRKYGHLLSSEGSASSIAKTKQNSNDEKVPDAVSSFARDKEGDAIDASGVTSNQEYKSRIMESGGATSALDAPTEMTADDDDGEGWVTSTRDIQHIKATGSLHLPQSGNASNGKRKSHPPKNPAPPITQRAACATTDFAMQNVILQMNLELLTVDGVRVRRLKTWVTRCAACFTIYGGSDDKKGKSGVRLFCDKCGSNALQRIAASVDRNTGRLKLHMKKNYQYNTRGTKFSLPKAGKGNKYEGDLLLAEDQLLYGAWAQKVRKGKSKSLGESMFGSDLASDLGCRADLTKRDDIKVGFGRRNPNSAKFGRERRGKKKKNTQDKACGLRRY
ncbi:hypothetical protein HJC23_013838 [Cyclotella cryptica]|uniref:20S-pre-rRNA D-site endonuclease NOB1 n=1 Tax=Cyclotella cryptica TaxID=29204 RepID=A0ABD3P9S4_9STRA